MCLHLEVLPQKSIWSQKETNFYLFRLIKCEPGLSSLYFFFLRLNIRENQLVVLVSGGRRICKLSHHRFTARSLGLLRGEKGNRRNGCSFSRVRLAVLTPTLIDCPGLLVKVKGVWFGQGQGLGG